MKNISARNGKQYIIPKLLISLLMALLFYLTYATNMFTYVDWTFQDMFFQKESETSSEIVVIGVTSQDLDRRGMWPWDRAIWAEVLGNINDDPATQPAAIGMTIPFYGTSQPISDSVLSDKLVADNLILACDAQFQTEFSANSTAFNQQESFYVSDISYPFLHPNIRLNLAHTNIIFDSDGILRHDLLSIENDQGAVLNSMAYATYSMYNQYHGLENQFNPELDENGFWYVDYSASAGGYFTYSVNDILEGNFEPADLAGKIVLIGVYDTTLMDYYRPSIDSSDNMFGVEFIANCVNAMLNDTEIQPVPTALEVTILLICVFVCTFLFLYLSFAMVSVLVLALLALGLYAIDYTYSLGALFPPFFFVAAMVLCYVLSVAFNFWFEWYTKKQVTNAFQHYVDPKVIEQVIADNNLHANGTTRNIAVLFVDLRGFTSMSEKLDAATLVRMLNKFFTLTDDCIKLHDGTLDKFIGDCAMAFWGAPKDSPDPVFHACCAAMEMVQRSEALSAEIYEMCHVKISFGIGIHYGSAVVGNVGSTSRLDYTAIGDTVNTAARLESIAPPNTIYVSEAIATAVEPFATLEKLENKLPLKGKKLPLDVYILKDIKRYRYRGSTL